MKRVYLLALFTFLIVLLVFSCKSKLAPVTHPIISDNAINTIVENESESDINYIYDFLDSIQTENENTIAGETLHKKQDLYEYYSKKDFQRYWTDSLRSGDAIIALITSWKEGLNPKDYHLEALLDLHHYLIEHPDDIKTGSEFDLLLSDGLLSYTDHLINGKLDPKSLYPSWNFFSRNLPHNVIDQLILAIDNDQIDPFLLSLTPQTREYRGFREGIIKYTNIVSMGGWKDLPDVNKVEPLSNSALTPLLKQRLYAEGYEVIPDSNRIYDQELVEQVKLFQISSGLMPDGVIGKNTIKAFNESAESKLNKLKVNMERSRWVLDGEMNEYIVVNIAKYQLYYLDSGSVIYTTKVMVGKDETQTPAFRDELEYIVFNPTWTLPQSISSKETLPHLIRDSLYLKNNNMVIIDSKGQVLSDSGIVWSDYNEEYFPFIIRQEPGPGNALGRVKFLFPNKYAVYLHDTPSKYLFAKEERAFSHGCIRVQNPLDFSELILSRQDSNWTMDSIRTVIDSAATMNVRLKKSIPIYIMYWTAGVDENERLFFVPDIYGRDERILKALGEL